MSEEVTEYIILDIIDDMEEAIFNAEKHDMVMVVTELKNVHGMIQDFGNSEAKIEKIASFNNAIKEPLKNLVVACQEGVIEKAENSLNIIKKETESL